MDPTVPQVDILSGHSVPTAVKNRRSYTREETTRARKTEYKRGLHIYSYYTAYVRARVLDRVQVLLVIS